MGLILCLVSLEIWSLLIIIDFLLGLKCGLMFAKKLKENLENRFPAKGTECLIYGKANYLSPLYKGIHLMAESSALTNVEGHCKLIRNAFIGNAHSAWMKNGIHPQGWC